MIFNATYSNGRSLKRRMVVALDRSRAYSLAQRCPPAGFSILTGLRLAGGARKGRVIA